MQSSFIGMVNDGERTYSRPVEKVNGGGGNLSKDSMVKAFLDIFKGDVTLFGT